MNAGTVVLTGNNTYSLGTTLIKDLGTLQIGNGGIEREHHRECDRQRELGL